LRVRNILEGVGLKYSMTGRRRASIIRGAVAVQFENKYEK
jgi:hypothetical protein